jgi:hypothetical protein
METTLLFGSIPTFGRINRYRRQCLASLSALCVVASFGAAPTASAAQAQLTPGPFEATVQVGTPSTDTLLGWWGTAVGAQSYRVLVRKNRTNGYEVVADNLPPTTSYLPGSGAIDAGTLKVY